MLARAERLRAERGWANVSLRLADAERAEWPERFDAALFSLSYSVLPRPQATLERVCGRLEPGGRIVVMDAVLPDGPLGRLLRLPATALSHATVLGDPDTRPWDDLAALGIEPDTARFMAGTYFVCSGRRPG
jgi:SAM-dependent methyltransferase